ncbi:hypothetical protein M9Y10_042585 [Tritrichomonas musculus]|uniref:Uncharacterized protein n=1 Tax=Tritrichomonas musculus TaxID=1915356 RepID=A0ABR2JXD7_9EUKA
MFDEVLAEEFISDDKPDFFCIIYPDIFGLPLTKSFCLIIFLDLFLDSDPVSYSVPLSDDTNSSSSSSSIITHSSITKISLSSSRLLKVVLIESYVRFSLEEYWL